MKSALAKIFGKIFKQEEPQIPQKIPQIESVELKTVPLKTPEPMTQADINNAFASAQKALVLAKENQRRLQILHKEQNMSFFEKIAERFGDRQTTISGIASMALPVILGALGVSHPHILLANAGFGVLTAWLSKKDTTSAAGLTGSFSAMALQTFGIPVPDFVISLMNGFTGFFSRDQK